MEVLVPLLLMSVISIVGLFLIALLWALLSSMFEGLVNFFKRKKNRKNRRTAYHANNGGSASDRYVSTGEKRTFNGSQTEDYRTLLEKRQSGTLTRQEQDEFDRKWGL